MKCSSWKQTKLLEEKEVDAEKLALKFLTGNFFPPRPFSGFVTPEGKTWCT